MENVGLNQINNNIEILKKMVFEIRENMDSGIILDSTDIKALESYEKEKKDRSLTSHEHLKKELGL